MDIFTEFKIRNILVLRRLCSISYEYIQLSCDQTLCCFMPKIRQFQTARSQQNVVMPGGLYRPHPLPPGAPLGQTVLRRCVCLQAQSARICVTVDLLRAAQSEFWSECDACEYHRNKQTAFAIKIDELGHDKPNLLEYASQSTFSELRSRSFGPSSECDAWEYECHVYAAGGRVHDLPALVPLLQAAARGTGRESGSAEYVSNDTTGKVDVLGSANGVSMLRCNEYWRHHCWVRRRSRNVKHKSTEHVFRNPVVYMAQHELLAIRT